MKIDLLHHTRLRERIRFCLSALLILGCGSGESTGPDGSGNAVVQSVSVAVGRSVVHPGDTVQAAATVLSSAGSVISGRTVSWLSDNAAVASVSATGMIRALDIGTANISASADGKSGSIQMRILVMPLGSVSIVPDTASLEIGRATTLAVLVKDSTGNTVSNRTLIWASSDTTKARVTGGVVTALAIGNVDITASAEGRSGIAHIRILPVVSDARVANVSVSIPRSAFRVGENLQAAALPLDSLGGVITGRQISWSSSDPEIVTVTAAGIVTGAGAGTAKIVAEVDGKVGSVTVQTSLVPVASVSIDPGTQSVSAGASFSLNAILKDSAGRNLTGRSVSWASSAPTVASVSQTGVVTGIIVGNSQITATVEGKEGKASVSVNTLATPVATVNLSTTVQMMSSGATKQITPTLKDANGNIISGRTIEWISSNASKAVVSSSGLITGLADGPVVITATVEGKSANINLNIVTFTRLSSGSGFTCGLDWEGTAYCWGVNAVGQIGDGTTVTRLAPTKVNTDLKFVAIASSANHTCGIAEGSLVYCWGANTNGKLGNGTTANSLIPVPVSGGYRFVSIAPSTNSTCGTTGDRQVYCWGFFRYDYMDIYGGYARFESKTFPVKVGDGMVAVIAGLDGSYCTVDATTLAYCWSLTYYFPMVSPGYPSNTALPIIGAPVSTTLHFTTLRRGLGHACGLIETGQAYCWGSNDYGQLGNGTTVSNSIPTPVSGGLLFESLAAGGTTRIDYDLQKQFSAAFTCGITMGGKAYCWGANRNGELGSASASTSATSPQPVAIENVTFTGLRGGASHVCGLAVGGPAYCWGSNATGQFGDGTTRSSNVPLPVFGKQ